MSALPQNYLTVLEYFFYETRNINDACRRYLKVSVIEETELFDKGTRLYEHVDPIITRGLATTLRLFVSDNETISFRAVTNILLLLHRENAETVARIREIKKNFNVAFNDAYSKNLLDRFWNVSFIHLDLGDDRHVTQHNIFHSCMGPLEMTNFFDMIQLLRDMLTETSTSFVRPILLESGVIHE